MDPELYLAYDGSINADWVARYALRLSSATKSTRLTLLHILDGALPIDRIAAKVERLAQESQDLNVELNILYRQREESVTASLLNAIPWGTNSYCICGARATSRNRGFLAGTISQELLRAKKFNTLALRVVNPGLLGCPANVLFPLSGHGRKFAAAMPFLLMLLPCVSKLVLLRVMTFHPLLFGYLSPARAKRALTQGISYLHEVMADIDRIECPYPLEVEDQVLISDDWVKEVLIQAGKARSGLILLGASDRLLRSHFYYGNKIEQVLRRTSCDVGIYRTL